jgi:putative FmdB family regulatory protein
MAPSDGRRRLPLYDFHCDACGAEFERLLLKQDETVECPSCLADSVTRLTVSSFTCTGVQVTKRLRLESEERMRKGSEQLSGKKPGGQQLRKQRIKIL